MSGVNLLSMGRAQMGLIVYPWGGHFRSRYFECSRNAVRLPGKERFWLVNENEAGWFPGDGLHGVSATFS